MKKELLLSEQSELVELAKLLLDGPRKGDTLLLALRGDLGAGKTTFVQTLGKALEVAEHITSPTFTIMKQYPLSHEQFDSLIHIDLYRIDDEAELVPLGFKEVLERPRTVVCVEWPQRVSADYFTEAIQVEFLIEQDERRRVVVEFL